MSAHQLKHPIGLSADPVAPVVTVKPFTGTVTQLPYMGKGKDDTFDTPYLTPEHNMKSVVRKERLDDVKRPEEFADPCEVLVKKIERMANMLKCSEADAERILFDRL